jgi:hypothetical protein
VSKLVPLKHPFEFGKDENGNTRQVESVTLNRLKGKHLRKLGGRPTMHDLLELASKSAGEPPALLDEMDAEDVMAVTEVIGDFLGGSLTTGETA